jgi:GMP synthase-like glutamine amidotransferase
MNLPEGTEIKVAILDLYEGVANQGMRCIKEIIEEWGDIHSYKVSYSTFDVRLKLEIPTIDFDIYISSGGPGSPIESNGTEWENKYFKWIESIEKWNNQTENFPKKHVLFICHSFQLAARYYQIGNVCKRKSTSFGVFPIHMLEEGKLEVTFEGLNDPFYGVDSRDYQVIEPNHNKIREMRGSILAIEKHRPHVPFERAIMALRFNQYFLGTQFHPEADPIGMSMYLQREDKKKTVIENHGEEKWRSMLEHLQDKEKIIWTHNHVLPNFLNHAVGELVDAIQ